MPSPVSCSRKSPNLGVVLETPDIIIVVKTIFLLIVLSNLYNFPLTLDHLLPYQLLSGWCWAWMGPQCELIPDLLTVSQVEGTLEHHI